MTQGGLMLRVAPEWREVRIQLPGTWNHRMPRKTSRLLPRLRRWRRRARRARARFARAPRL